jgi:hypothetical protein
VIRAKSPPFLTSCEFVSTVVAWITIGERSFLEILFIPSRIEREGFLGVEGILSISILPLT